MLCNSCFVVNAVRYCLSTQVVRCNGFELLPYKSDLFEIIKSCVGLKCKRAFHFAAKVCQLNCLKK